eukprot:CAMPEP_0197449146 /NCGR_PEP_ID=MMETSP1175-20131217/20171_1 /TAXON_ID=1003142 /ORGANISM="Triceratium dubium, Strain CCMP147" /LENGTH=73 /DNA_ID=CAMNT_0042981171 /DNA_START=170 /DNA_END=391 /DNA_ORIENTATION=+
MPAHNKDIKNVLYESDYESSGDEQVRGHHRAEKNHRKKLNKNQKIALGAGAIAVGAGAVAVGVKHHKKKQNVK